VGVDLQKLFSSVHFSTPKACKYLFMLKEKGHFPPCFKTLLIDQNIKNKQSFIL
jgi:hypothetical protein